MPVDANRVILTGENSFLRLSEKDGAANTTDASHWRILFSPAGPGHVLYLRSELTEGKWRIYADNIALARWLQETVQGMLNPDLKDTSIPVIDAVFDKSGDMRSYWSEHVHAADAEIDLTWFDTGDPLLVHTQPNEPPQNRPYGVCTVLIPVTGTRLTVNGVAVPLEEGARYGNLACVSRDGAIRFGLIRTTPQGEAYLLLDPSTLEWAEIGEEEAARLGLFQSEDDWGLGTGLLD